MTTDLDQRLHALDPAEALTDGTLDVHGAAATAIRRRALDGNATNPTLPGRPRWGRRIVIGGVTIAAVATGAMAVADRPPPVYSEDVCEGGFPGNPYYPYPPPACADVAIPGMLASIEENGTELERRLAADGVITQEEYESAKSDLLECAVAEGVDGALDPHPYLDVTLYGLFTRLEAGVDHEAIWKRCGEDELQRISSLYQYQAIGRQPGPRLTPREVEEYLSKDDELPYEPYDPIGPTKSAVPVDE